MTATRSGVDRAVPYDVAAEEAVLGSILLDRDRIIQAAAVLKPADFFRETHATIYEAMLSLYARRLPTDPVTLGSELERVGKLDQVGGRAYLVGLVTSTPTAAHVEYYAGIVERASVMRSLISAGGAIAALGYRDDAEVDEVLGDADRLLLEVASRRNRRGYRSMKAMVADYMDHLERLAQRPDEITGIPSQFSQLDAITGGWFGGKLVIVAGRPGHGKTSWLMGEVVHSARRGVPVGMFSLEMPESELMERWYAEQSRVDSKKLRTGRYISQDEWGRIGDSTGRLPELPLYVDDEANLTITDLRARVIRLKAEQGIRLLAVDYLNLITAPRKDQNRVLEVGEVARKLKILAREADVAILCAAQLNREVERRANHVPTLADLRESGEIEQHADMVMFVHRPEMYEQTADNAGVAELHIAKHRAGPLGMVTLQYRGEYTQFRAVTDRAA